jgi:hypothetical protein
MLVLIAAAFSCREPTAIRVRLYSDIAWAPERTLAVYAGRTPGVDLAAPDTTATAAWESPYLGDLVLVPPADDASAYLVVVMGVTRPPSKCRLEAPDGCIVARRHTSFVNHKTLTLPVTLYAACLGVRCDENSTCSAIGTCVPADVPPEACSSEDGCLLPGETLPQEAGAPPAMPDAASEAEVSWCAAHARKDDLCTDFDTADGGTPWDENYGEGPWGTGTAPGVSGSKGQRWTIAPVSDAGVGYSFARSGWNLGAPAGASCEFSMRLEADGRPLQRDGYYSFFGFVFSDGEFVVHVPLQRDDSLALFVYQASTQSTTTLAEGLAAPLSLRDWTHFQFEFGFGSSPRMTVRIGDGATPAYDGPLPFTPTNAEFTPGIWYVSQPHEGWSIAYDNVLCRVTK